MNTVKIEITSCNQCPHKGRDINKTRLYCEYWRTQGSFRSQFLYWFGSEEENDFPIPDWCPLLEDKTND